MACARSGRRPPGNPVFEALLFFIANWFLITASVAVLVSAIMAIAVSVTLAVARIRARPPARRGLGRPAFRLRVWHFMAAILVFGALLQLVIAARRAFNAYRTAQEYAAKAATYRDLQDWGSLEPSVLEYFRAMQHYHEQMSQKCYDGACHPWHPAPTAPPEPKLEFYLMRGIWRPRPLRGGCAGAGRPLIGNAHSPHPGCLQGVSMVSDLFSSFLPISIAIDSRGLLS